MTTPRKKKIIPASRMGDVIDDMGPIPGGPRGRPSKYDPGVGKYDPGPYKKNMTQAQKDHAKAQKLDKQKQKPGNEQDYRQRKYLVVLKNRKKTRVLGGSDNKQRALTIREGLAKKLKIPKSNIRIKDQGGSEKVYKQSLKAHRKLMRTGSVE